MSHIDEAEDPQDKQLLETQMRYILERMKRPFIYAYGDKDRANLDRVLRSGNLGARDSGMVGEFERQFAGVHDAKHGIAANSAMSLLHAAIHAAGAGAGDEVICDPIVQFGAVACMYNNARPVFADVNPRTLLIDPESVRQRISPYTKAIIATHLWGYPAELRQLRAIADQHGLVLIEDCAHALLARYGGRYVGTWGHVGIFSFNYSKQMSTGDGGAAICDDDAIERRMRDLLIFGESPRELAWNYRMTELTAAVASAEFERLPGYVRVYDANLRLYDEAIGDCDWLIKREATPDSTPTGYWYGRIFRGDTRGIQLADVEQAAEEVGADMELRFTQQPAYRYRVFREPLAYGNKGCPFKCPYYKGDSEYRKGLCPNAEEVLPRLVYTTATISAEATKKNAELWRKVIDVIEGHQ